MLHAAGVVTVPRLPPGIPRRVVYVSEFSQQVRSALKGYERAGKLLCPVEEANQRVRLIDADYSTLPGGRRASLLGRVFINFRIVVVRGKADARRRPLDVAYCPKTNLRAIRLDRRTRRVPPCSQRPPASAFTVTAGLCLVLSRDKPLVEGYDLRDSPFS